MTTLRTLACSLILATTALVAQTLVGTAPQPRTALLEKYTAINCGNCPAASSVSNALENTYGSDLLTINVHGGGLANPSTGQPDFRTADGAALWVANDVFFQPQGSVGRGPLQQANGWGNSIGSLLTQTSHVNIGTASTYDAGTAQLTVSVELYYTADAPTTEERIHVALTQDHITGYQQDYVNGAQPTYDHRHVLRDLVTPLAGDPVTTTQQGDFVQRTYTVSVPATWNVSALQVVAFVGAVDGAVWQVRSVAADGGATVGVTETTDRFLGLGAAFPVPAAEQITIPLTAEAQGTLLLRDAVGRVVLQQRVAAGTPTVVLPVTSLAEGVYTYGFSNGAARPVVVVR